MPADALVTLGASASLDTVLTPKARIFCFRNQKSQSLVNKIYIRCIMFFFVCFLTMGFR